VAVVGSLRSEFVEPSLGARLRFCHFAGEIGGAA
jgi:hypothetical protein